jgi:hypothetical protein
MPCLRSGYREFKKAVLAEALKQVKEKEPWIKNLSDGGLRDFFDANFSVEEAVAIIVRETLVKYTGDKFVNPPKVFFGETPDMVAEMSAFDFGDPWCMVDGNGEFLGGMKGPLSKKEILEYRRDGHLVFRV